MKKNIIAAAAFMLMTGGIANAASLGNSSSVEANFTVIGGCAVTGNWTANTISAGTHAANTQKVGTLDIALTGCTSEVYFKGQEIDSAGQPVATSPSGKKISIMPDFITIGNTWIKNQDLNAFYSSSALADGQTISVDLVNFTKWDAEPGVHTMTLEVGTYTL
ncbi:CD15/CS22/SEF14 family fimbrial major subunit [Escherichia coli]